MITRWQYYLTAAMITRWHYCISVEIGIRWIHWIVNVSNCKELWIARRKHQHLQTAGKHHYLRKLDGVPQKERHMDRKSEKMGMQCYMKKEDNSLIDVENVETTGERYRQLSWRTPLYSSLCTFTGMKHISPTCMYIIPMYLRLTTFSKQMSFHLYFLLFLFRSGAPPRTLLTAGALTYPRLPATASNVCTTDARLGGVGRCPPPPPPNKSPGYAGSWARWKIRLGGQ